MVLLEYFASRQWMLQHNLLCPDSRRKYVFVQINWCSGLNVYLFLKIDIWTYTIHMSIFCYTPQMYFLTSRVWHVLKTSQLVFFGRENCFGSRPAMIHTNIFYHIMNIIQKNLLFSLTTWQQTAISPSFGCKTFILNLNMISRSPHVTVSWVMLLWSPSSPMSPMSLTDTLRLTVLSLPSLLTILTSILRFQWVLSTFWTSSFAKP